MKPRIFLPMVAAAGLALAQTYGPHDPHVVESPVQEMPQMVGFLASSMMSTATATVALVPNSYPWRALELSEIISSNHSGRPDLNRRRPR